MKIENSEFPFGRWQLALTGIAALVLLCVTAWMRVWFAAVPAVILAAVWMIFLGEEVRTRWHMSEAWRQLYEEVADSAQENPR